MLSIFRIDTAILIKEADHEIYVLQQAAASAARAAAAKSPIPTLEGLLIEAGASVRITGYDLKKAIYTTIDADIPEGADKPSRWVHYGMTSSDLAKKRLSGLTCPRTSSAASTSAT